MAIEKLQSPQFRDVLVTDVEWRFDYGLTDALTLKEGDTLDTESEPGWVVVTLQHPGGFPEIVRHQVSKIISERHQLRVQKVPITPGPGVLEAPEAPGAGSTVGPVDPAPAMTGASRHEGPVSQTDDPPFRQALPAPPSPRPRRKRSVRPPMA